MTPTPGAYLKMRRCASGLSVGEVASRLDTEPHVDERARTEWLELVEADAQPVSLSTIVALRKIFEFNLDVIIKLERIVQGSTEQPPRICRHCGFTWPAENDVCSACASIERAPAEASA